MSKKHNQSGERDSFPTWRPKKEYDRVITEFSYVGEGGGWIIVPVGECPSDLPEAQRRYAQHMGWISIGTAEDPVTLPDTTETKEVDHDAEVVG